MNDRQNLNIQVVATAGFGGDQMDYISSYVRQAFSALNEKPVNMLVFEEDGEGYRIRAAGYDLMTDSILDETTVIKKFDIKLPNFQKFFFKLDRKEEEYSYIGTFLYPHEY